MAMAEAGKWAVLICLFFTGFATAQLDSTEISALKEIRSSMQDLQGSPFFSTWDFSLDPCLYFSGVVCMETGQDGNVHIVMLSLGNGFGATPGLAGSLSPALGSLKYLRALTIVPGKIKGSIPASLGSLSQLQFLGIRGNQLTGSIPDELANLSSLQGLDLSNNQLSGPIPAGISNLPSLITLVLSINQLTGSVPSFSGPLIHLNLEKNMLSGSLPSLPQSLKYLSLSQNSLSGSLNQLASLQRLNYLDLSFNKFEGKIPSELFGFSLSDLLLQRNALSGNIVVTAQALSINRIDVSYNSLAGEIPTILSTVPSLYVNNNKLSGQIPSEFVVAMVLGGMQNLYLQHNYFSNIAISTNLDLPASCIFCVQYNCLDPPTQNSCPDNAGRETARPQYQCNDINGNWD